MLRRDQRPEDEPVPCACCGKPSETTVWQLELCVRCGGRWTAEVVPPPCHTEKPTITIDADRRTVTWPTPTAERNRQWEAATAEWLKNAKARAA